jgi:hypothetical protein
VLRRHTARLQCLEVPAHLDGIEQAVRREPCLQQPLQVPAAGFAADLKGIIRPEIRHGGEGCTLVVPDRRGDAIGADLVEGAVNRDHFAVERLEGTESEVTVPLHRAVVGDAIVVTDQQGGERGHLKQGVRFSSALPLGVERCRAQDCHQHDRRRGDSNALPFAAGPDAAGITRHTTTSRLSSSFGIVR